MIDLIKPVDLRLGRTEPDLLESEGFLARNALVFRVGSDRALEADIFMASIGVSYPLSAYVIAKRHPCKLFLLYAYGEPNEFNELVSSVRGSWSPKRALSIAGSYFWFSQRIAPGFIASQKDKRGVRRFLKNNTGLWEESLDTALRLPTVRGVAGSGYEIEGVVVEWSERAGSLVVSEVRLLVDPHRGVKLIQQEELVSLRRPRPAWRRSDYR